MTPSFPTVFWDETPVTFLPQGVALPAEARIEAALVFAFYDSRFVLADISGRGWCIPSGRIEAGEIPEETARREAYEEAGALLDRLAPLGTTLVGVPGEGAAAAPNYLGIVAELAPIPPGSESHGIRLAALEELPDCYFRWDALLEAVFRYAWEQYQALF